MNDKHETQFALKIGTRLFVTLNSQVMIKQVNKHHYLNLDLEEVDLFTPSFLLLLL